MSLRECLLLIPCSGLDDFPEALPEGDSQQVLTAWLALWHPQLLAATHAAPRWQSANQPPHSFEGSLCLAPDCAQPLLPSDMGTTVRNGGGWLVENNSAKPAELPSKSSSPSSKPWLQRSWRELQSQLLDTVGIEALPEFNPYLQTEFAALGYAYLQIQLLTRQLRYTSNLDQLLFDTQLDQAAQAALAGDVGQAETMLQSCFDQLGQERDHYYSLDVSLLDVTLLAETTLGNAVISQLDRDMPTTFVASAHLLRKMKQEQPDVAATLHRAISERRAVLAGGLDQERPHPLMTFDTLRRDLERGKQAYRELGLEPPSVFTRLSFGQFSEMPLHLRRSGYSGVMLVAWQAGTYPSGSHSKFSWEASEGTFLNAVAPPLADANSAATYLTLGKRIADALDHQHVPVFMLAHWPNQYSPFFELFARVVKRTPALGKWQNVDDFFDKTDQPYHQEHLPAKKFVHDWLGHDPDHLMNASLSYHRLAAQARSLQNVLNLVWQLERYHEHKPQANPADTEPITNYADPGPQAVAIRELDGQLSEAIDLIDGLFDSSASVSEVTTIESLLSQISQRLSKRFAAASGYQVLQATSEAEAAGLLLINPVGAAQRMPVTTSTSRAPAIVASAPGGDAKNSTWLYASGASQNQTLSMIDMPGFSVLPVPLTSATSAPRKREPMLVPAEGLLQNDFLEAQIDPRTGALRSLHMPGKRGNRLSMQVARREKSGSAAAEYSIMQLRNLTTIENSTMRGHLRASGVCMWRSNTPTANFELDYELLRGQRTLQVTVRLSQLQSLNGSPWQQAYVLRTAWPSEAAILTARNCSSRETLSSGKCVASELIEIDDVEHRVYLLPSGLSFHQRVEQRFLDTILTTGQAVANQYRMTIGVDLPNASATALQISQPTMSVLLSANGRLPSDPAQCTAAWLMHVDSKTVLMQLEAPLVDEQGKLAGMRIHLSELVGKSVTTRIRSLREVSEAHRVDYLGGRIAKLSVDGDATTIAMRPHEMTFVDLIWK